MFTKTTLIFLVITLTACSSTPPKLVMPDKVEKLERHELIMAINECRDNDLRPHVSYSVVRLQNSTKVLVPIDVFCTAYRK